MALDKNQVIGHYGEMAFVSSLHDKGWHVYRAYIDENVDFIITKYICTSCNKLTELYVDGQCLTNKCKHCKRDTVDILTKFIQVKTSEGVVKNGNREYSFHAKLRSNVGPNSYYCWIAVVKKDGKKIPHFYIFHHTEINKFDDLNIDSYQVTDNQKTAITINESGIVTKKGRKYSYECFKEFHDNFEKFDPNYKLVPIIKN